MKALTVKQPWAYLICSGIKNIENRTWYTKYRGKVLIHASSKNLMPYGDWSNRIPLYPLSNDQRSSLNGEQIYDLIHNGVTVSSIIGSVEIVDCVTNHDSIWAEKSGIYTHSHTGVISNKPVWNWVLANPILFKEPILNVKGALSFWEFKGELSNFKNEI